MTYTLAFESSCDDTSIALFKNDQLIITETASQVKIHRAYGGVVPELAAREHTKNIIPLFNEVLEKGGVTLQDIGLIVVTIEPGLIGSLLVGTECARAIAKFNHIPIKGVHHIAGHLHAAHLTHSIPYPYLGVAVSGGHTHIYIVYDIDRYELIGWTLDDAAGEAYDKVAKMCGLTYPGGPVIDQLAQKWSGAVIPFPRPLLHQKNFNYSFSGLKTAVSLYLKKNPHYILEQVAASFQKAVVEVLLYKLKKAADHYQLNNIVISGGVAANSELRKGVATQFKDKKVFFPELKYCMDNAAMIGYVGIKLFEKHGEDQFESIQPHASKVLATL